jgi:hypothetical protein
LMQKLSTKCISPPNMHTSPHVMNWRHNSPLVGNAWIKSTNASKYFSNRQRALQHAKIET